MGEPRVVATAGHVDHGKSSLIVGLTGIDPDRWAEEKRRGLTIDLGYAWCRLPSGRELGFVDAVVAVTKRDLVDDDGLELAVDEVRGHLAGTALGDAPIVPVSATTGAGLDALRDAIDAMLAAAPQPEPSRPRLFVDRSFTIPGAGTVATGTLGGGCLSIGDEVEVYPIGRRVRLRGLQSHERTEDRTCAVARVAANLVGIEREAVSRGDVLGPPGSWRPATLFEATLRPVRGLGHPITARGAYKVH